MMKNRQKMMAAALITVILTLNGCAGKTSAEVAEANQTESLSGSLIEDAKAPVFNAEGIRKLSITEDQREHLLISYEPETNENPFEYWKIPVPYGREAVIDTEVMLELYGQLAALRFDTVIANPGDETTNISKSGTSVAVEYCRGISSEDAGENTSYPADADSRFTLTIGSSNGDGSYYTALDAAPETIYLMPENAIDSILAASPFNLVLKIPAVVDIESVAEVAIHADGTDYQMSRQSDRYSFNEQEVSEQVYHALYMELQSILVCGELSAEQKTGTEPLLDMDFKRIDGTPGDVTVSFHAYQDSQAQPDLPLDGTSGDTGELVSVSVNGTEVLLAAKTDVDALILKIDEAFQYNTP